MSAAALWALCDLIVGVGEVDGENERNPERKAKPRSRRNHLRWPGTFEEGRRQAARCASIAADWRESAAANRLTEDFVMHINARQRPCYVTIKCLRMHGPAGCSTFGILTPRKGGGQKKRN